MSTADISGRDLDVAVALALGWSPLRRKDKWTDNKTIDHPGPVVQRRLPRFHTDPATLDEKLAWLRNRCDHVEIIVWRDGEVEAATCRSSMHRGDRRIHGRNLHDATARLVVAVKEAMGDG